MRKLKEIIKKPETRKWIADKAGGGIVGAITVVALDFIVDRELDTVADIIALLTE